MRTGSEPDTGDDSDITDGFDSGTDIDATEDIDSTDDIDATDGFDSGTDIDAVDEADAGASRTTRRRALTNGATVVLSGLTAFWLTPTGPERPSVAADVDVVDDGAGAVTYLRETYEDETDSPIARFQYEPSRSGFHPTAPINVVFPLADDPFGLPAVMTVLFDAGWTQAVEEYARFGYDRRRERYVAQHATAAETYLGLHGRLHVRCWEFEGVVSMQVHEDTPARPKHGIRSYADAREDVLALYRSAGWRVADGTVDLRNERDPDHDGTASVVVPGERG